MNSRRPKRNRTRLGQTVRTSEDEITALVHMSNQEIVRLTGPQFPLLPPRHAAVTLMAIALSMPRSLRLRTIHLAVNLFETGNWHSSIIAAARTGDPAAAALAKSVLETMMAEVESASDAVGDLMN